MFLKNKYIVTLLDENWKIIKDKIELSSIPKQDELIYIEGLNNYYRIKHVIHHLQPKHNVVLILKIFTHDVKVDLQKK